MIMSSFKCFIIAVLAFRGMFFVEEFDKQINFSSEQCVDFKNVNGEKWQLHCNIALMILSLSHTHTQHTHTQAIYTE